VDIKLTPLALTHAQVTTYELPRIPVKESDRRKPGFEERYGAGAVELDALEALRPGELAELVREAVAPYRGQRLAGRFYEVAREAQRAAEDQWAEQITVHEAERAEILDGVSRITAHYQERLALLNAELQAELEPWRERMDTLRHTR
jgi:hypothetical protein